MHNEKACVLFWSGGKDSALALARCRSNPDLEVKLLFTTFTDDERVAMHEVPRELVVAQAGRLGVPLQGVVMPPMPEAAIYESLMLSCLRQVKAEHGITHVIFGDIFLRDLRQYREDLMAKVGLECIFPLWDEDTAALLNEFYSTGYRARIVCARGNLEALVGADLSPQLIASLPSTVDPCGENGEYHSFVYDGPAFSTPLDIVSEAPEFRRLEKDPSGEDSPGFWFSKISPAPAGVAAGG